MCVCVTLSSLPASAGRQPPPRPTTVDAASDGASLLLPLSNRILLDNSNLRANEQIYNETITDLLSE